MVLVPRGGAALAERTREIRSDLAGALIVERQFLHPVEGADALHLRHRPVGRDVAASSCTTSATRRGPSPIRPKARCLLRDGDEARLVMRDGVALGLSEGGAQLNAVDYEQFVFDLSELIDEEDARAPRPAEYPVRLLLDPTPADAGPRRPSSAGITSPRRTTS